MDERIALLLADATVRNGLCWAWRDSEPGVFGAHEEGGFICAGADGGYVVDRWQTGDTDRIRIPPHPGGKRNNEWIVATFHTHPNTSNRFEQTPNAVDCALIANDIHLRTVYYQGEFVISASLLYFVRMSGRYEVLGATATILEL